MFFKQPSLSKGQGIVTVLETTRKIKRKGKSASPQKSSTPSPSSLLHRITEKIINKFGPQTWTGRDIVPLQGQTLIEGQEDPKHTRSGHSLAESDRNRWQH
jgi:hypothetical protein